MDKSWDEKVSEFFLEYVKPIRVAYTPSGNLTFTAIKNSAQFLLQENVFTSKEDMRDQAMRDYGIILPETIFN